MKKDLEKLGLADVKDWVFDLDNTIYPANSSLFPRVAERMTDFIMAHFNLSREEAAEMKTRLFRTYGTTMHGLMKEHNMSPDAFLAYVHEIDLSDVSYDGELDKSIARLPGRKHIYTNGTTRHAERILEAFGIRQHFEVIFDIVASNHIPKPNPAPYQVFIDQNKLNPKSCLMIEDMARNLEPAAAMGMKTVWLASDHDWAANGKDEAYVHYVSADLKSFLAEIDRANHP